MIALPEEVAALFSSAEFVHGAMSKGARSAPGRLLEHAIAPTNDVALFRVEETALRIRNLRIIILL